MLIFHIEERELIEIEERLLPAETCCLLACCCYIFIIIYHYFR